MRQKKDRDVVTALEHERVSARASREKYDGEAGEEHTHVGAVSQPRFGSTVRDGAQHRCGFNVAKRIPATRVIGLYGGYGQSGCPERETEGRVHAAGLTGARLC